jgi:hypothetical protein
MKFKLSALILALLASSVTLWLIESPLKYAFYFFEASLILILLYSLSGKLRKIKVETNKNIVTKFDYAFLTISTLLLIFNILKLDNVLTLLCAITVSFFLPGYVLLRLLKFHSLESWIEWLALSFALSIGVTSIIFTTMLPFAAGRAVPLSAIYVGMSLCPLLKDWIYKPGEKPQVRLENRVKEYDLADVLLLLWITVFFVFAISSLYPQMSFRPGLDIVRHFSSSRLLALAPDAYSSNYLWFHASWANIYELSSPPMEMFQTGLAYLSVMVIFTHAARFAGGFGRHLLYGHRLRTGFLAMVLVETYDYCLRNILYFALSSKPKRYLQKKICGHFFVPNNYVRLYSYS